MISQPDQGGHFGPYGGRYVPEVLMAPIEELETAYLAAREDPAFQAELSDLLRNYAGRPTPLYFAKRLTETLGGAPGILQGAYSFVLQDADGQIALTHSVSAGLDYAMIGPEHAWLHDQKRGEYVAASDDEALAAARLFSRTEGIIPALESSHAIAEAVRRAPGASDEIFIVNVSGRGDKDIDIYRENFPEMDEK